MPDPRREQGRGYGMRRASGGEGAAFRRARKPLTGMLSPENCGDTELEGEAAGRAGRKFERICRELLLPQGQPGVVIYAPCLKSSGPPLSLPAVGKRCEVILASGAGAGQSLAWPSASAHRRAGQKYCMLGTADAKMKPWLSVIP